MRPRVSKFHRRHQHPPFATIWTTFFVSRKKSYHSSRERTINDDKSTTYHSRIQEFPEVGSKLVSDEEEEKLSSQQDVVAIVLGANLLCEYLKLFKLLLLFFAPVLCHGCTFESFCIAFGAYVLCPVCKIINPMTDEFFEGQVWA